MGNRVTFSISLYVKNRLTVGAVYCLFYSVNFINTGPEGNS